MNLDDPTARLRRAAQHEPAAPELPASLVSDAPARHAPRLVRHGRAARATAISVTAVAAISVGALVVANPVSSPAPLFAAAAGASRDGEAAALSADSRIALWADYEYRAGAGLSTSGGRGSVYELRRTGDPESVLRAAAAALGLDGTPRTSEYSTPEYPSYVVGSEDGSAASLTLSWAGTGDWWYNDPAAYPAAVCEIVTPDDAGKAEGDDVAAPVPYQECTQPELPASASLAPSAAEARRLAAEIFAATGFAVDPAAVRVTSDAWQTVATAGLVVDGQATAIESSIAWTPLGEIAWASGHSIEVVDRGGYDTVSPASAVDRLSDWRWSGAAGADYPGGAVAFAADGLARDMVDVPEDPADTPVSSDGSGRDAGLDPVPAEPDVVPGEPAAEPGVSEPGDPGEPDPSAEPSEPSEQPVDPGLVDPAPAPTPETITVTMERAEATLLLMWDADGNAWLVPGYAYENPEQGFWTTTVSLVDGVITLPEPVEIEPMPALID